MNLNQSNHFLTKFIQLTVRTIYRYRIDVGVVRWIFLILNFLYLNSLMFPMTKLKQQYSGVIDETQLKASYIQDLNTHITKQIGWREGYKFLFLAARPTLILNFNENNDYNLFLAILIMLILLLIYGGACYAVIYTNCNHHKQFFFMKHVLLIANVYNYFFMMLIVEILVTIGIHGGFGNNVEGSFVNNTSSVYFTRVISIIMIPFAYIFSLFSLLFGEQCITHEEYGLFRNNSNNPIMICITSLKFIMAFIIGIDPNYERDSTFILIILINLLYILLLIYEFYHDIPFSSFKVQNVYYLLANQTLIMVVLSFFRDDSRYTAITDYTPHLLGREIFALILITISLVFQIFSLRMWNTYKSNILYSNTSCESQFKKSDHRYLSRRINMLIMNQKSSLENESVSYIGIFSKHQKFCLDKYCFCHLQQMMKGEQNSQLLLNSRVYEQLIRMYIRNDLRLMDVFHKREDSFQFLRYMDHFLYVKKHTFALYKIIDIQIESEKMKKAMNIKTQISLQVMLEILKETMSNDIKKGIVDLTVEQTSKAIEIYIQMENLKSILKVMIYKCLEMKKETLDLMKKSFEFSQEVEDLNSQYINQLDTTENMLIDFYNKYTTPLNQQILVFFESEIKGNLKKAHYIKQAHKQSDIAEYLNSKNMFIEVFSSDVISITATVGKKLGRIVGYSDKAPTLFGYKKQEFDYLSDIKDLMPITLAKVHDEVVRFMMIRGKYNVVHIARTVFLRNKNNFIFQVNIFADINFFYSEELPFIFMAKVIKTSSGFFIVNQKGRIEGICQNFFQKIGQPIESLPFMFKVDVQYVIPKFDELIMNIKPFQKIDFQDIDLTFPEIKSSLFYDLFYKNKQARQNFTSQADKEQNQGVMQLDSLRTQMSQVRTKLNQRDSDVLKFKTDISIQQRNLGTTKGDLVYYVIEIKSVQLSQRGNSMYNSLNNSTNFSMKQTNLQRQKSNFSKVDKETIQQVVTMSSSEQFDEDINNPPKSTYVPEETIAESEGESKVSSSSLDFSRVQGQKKTQSSKKTNQKLINRIKEENFLQNKQTLNDSQMLLIQRNISFDQIQCITPAETSRSMAVNQYFNLIYVLLILFITFEKESEIMVEHRFESLQETLHGQLIQKANSQQSTDIQIQNYKILEGSKLPEKDASIQENKILDQIKQNEKENPPNYKLEHINQIIQDPNEISIDINQINNTIQDQYQHPNKELDKDQKIVNQINGNQSVRSIRTSKTKSDNKSQLTLKSMKTSVKKENLSAQERYRQAQTKLQKNKSSNDYSLTQSESKEGLGEKLKAGSSINGDESDKIRQIDKFSYFEAFTEQKTQPQSLKFLKALKFFEFSTMIITSIVIATQINNFLSSFIQSADGILFRGNLMMPYSTFTTTEFLMRQIKQMSTYPNQQTVITALDNSLSDSYLRFYSNMTQSYQKNNLIQEFSDDYINIINPYLIQKNSDNEVPISDEYRIDVISSNFTFIDSLGQKFIIQVQSFDTVNTFIQFYDFKLRFKQNQKQNLFSTQIFYCFINKMMLLCSIKQRINENNNNQLGIDETSQATQNANQIQSIMYMQHNYKNFLKRCLENISSQFTSTIDMKENLNLIVIVVSSLMVIFTFIVYVVIIMNYKIFQQRMVQLLNIITTVKTSSVENEIVRVVSILESLKENDEIIEKFTFSIRQKEYLLTKFSDDEEQYQLNQDSKKRKALYVKINQQKLSNVRFFVISSFTMLIFFIYILVNLFVNIAFLDTYKPALQCLNDFGRMNFELPSLFTYTSIIHEYKLNNLQQFQNLEIEKIRSYFSESLQFVSDFSLGAYEINKKKFFSTQFVDSFNSKLQSDLCQYYPQIGSQECLELFNGSLSQGLVNALSTWKELFKQTMNIDFLITNNSDFYQSQVKILKFSLVLNESMSYFTNVLYNEVKNIIKAQQNLVLLFAILFSIIITIPKMYELTIEYSTISRRFFMAKKIVFMLPLYTLMIEETFNKMLKAIGNQLDIQK